MSRLISFSSLNSRSEKLAFPSRRYILFSLAAILCLVIGALSVSLDYLVAYGGEVARRELAEEKIFLSYDLIQRKGFGAKLDRITVNIPQFQISEQLDSVTIELNILDTLRLRPVISVNGSGLGGTFSATIVRASNGDIELETFSANAISLKSSTSLAPLLLTGGIITGSMTTHEVGATECGGSNESCRAIVISADGLEKSASSEITLPASITGTLRLPGISFASAVPLPPLPRTSVAAEIVLLSRGLNIRSASLHSKGVELSASGRVPVGTEGVAATGWGDGIALSGTITLERSLAAVAPLILNGPWVQGKITPDKSTSFSVTGGLIRPKLVIQG
jgi:hypothetical protein